MVRHGGVRVDFESFNPWLRYCRPGIRNKKLIRPDRMLDYFAFRFSSAPL